MAAPIFLLLLELLRRLLTLVSFVTILVGPVLVFVLLWRVRRGSQRPRKAALQALILVPLVSLVAALGFLWLRSDGFAGRDLSELTLRPRIGPLHSLATTSDGRWAFVSGGVSSVALCGTDPPSTCHRERSDDTSLFEAVDISPDGRLLAAITSSCVLKVWERSGSSFSALYQVRLDGGVCLALHFSRGSPSHLYTSWLAALSTDTPREIYAYSLYRLDAQTGEVLARQGVPVPITDWRTPRGAFVADLPIHIGRVSDIDSSDSGEAIATSSYDGTVKLWRPGSTSPARSFGHGDREFSALALGPSRIVAGRTDGQLSSWDLADSEGECDLDAHTGGPLMPLRAVQSIDYSVASGLAASGGFDRQVVLSNPSDCVVVKRLSGHRGAVTGISFVRGGEVLISSSRDGTVKLWSVTSTSAP